MTREYYLYVNGHKTKVSEQTYRVYWQEREHEKYLERVDKKNHLLFFSYLDNDGHFADNLEDKNINIEKIAETQIMIETLRNAILKLNEEEREIIDRLYFKDETLRSVAQIKNISHPALIKKRNKILEKLKKSWKKFKILVTIKSRFSFIKRREFALFIFHDKTIFNFMNHNN